MSRTLKAIYRDGAFVPQTPCDLPDDAEVELTISEPRVLAPQVIDPEERRRIMEKMVARMRANPIPAAAPRRFTREELHERR